MTPEEPTPTPGPRRGWLSLYAAAFAAMVGAGIVFAVATIGTLESLRLLRVSSILSGIAIVVAVVALVLPRRRS